MFIKHILCARQVLRAKHLVVNDSDTDALDALMESAVLNFILLSIFYVLFWLKLLWAFH